MSAKKNIPIESIEPDSYFNAPLWLNENYLLVAGENLISAELLRNLSNWCYKEVWSEGTLVSGGINKETVEEAISGAVLNDDENERESMEQTRHLFEDMARFTQKTFAAFKSDSLLDLGMLTEKVKGIIQYLKSNRRYILRISDLKADGMDYIYTHSTRSTIIALAIGETLKMPNFRLIELGIAAVLHELGMIRIPNQTYDKQSALSETESQLITTHPIQGMRMLQEYSKDSSKALAQEILLGIMQHHERMNGTGYPQGLKGDQISLFGKIIGVACSYEAQMTQRPHRAQKDGYTCMLSMLKGINSLYDEKVISALLLSISLYPLGTYVRLSNDAIGIVVDTDPAKPKCPIIRLILDKELNIYKESPIVKTKSGEGLSVRSVLDRQEINELIQSDLLPG